MPAFRTTIFLILSAAIVWAGPAADPAKLRRIPRIYNALITSDEELLPSQAYPAVAPVLRPAPLSYAPYYNLAPLYPPASYSDLPGFNDTLQDPQGMRAAPLFNLQPQQIIPQVTDQVKNNRPNNPDIPDVPPPPLPVSPPRSKDQPAETPPPQNFPPSPLQGLPF